MIGVTGANGYIGGRVLAHLRAAGVEALAMVRRPSADAQRRPGDLRARRFALAEPLEPTVLEGIETVVHAAWDLSSRGRQIHAVYVDGKVKHYLVDVIRATRHPAEYGLDLGGLIQLGASTRATIALHRAAKAHAFLSGRGYVTPEDVERLFVPVLIHRILFRPSFLAEIRDRGWDAAAAHVRDRCLEVAPKPGFDIDLDVPAAVTA